MDLEMKNKIMNSYASFDTIEWNVEDETNNKKRNERKKGPIRDRIIIHSRTVHEMIVFCVRKIQMRSIKLWIFLSLRR